MACVLPFNHLAVDDVIIASPADFVYGSGTLNLTGQDSAVTTADGQIHNYRSSLTPEASCEVRGDVRNRDTGSPTTWDGQTWPTLSGKVTLSLVSSRNANPVPIKTFAGMISVQFDSATNKSSLSISGCDAEY